MTTTSSRPVPYDDLAAALRGEVITSGGPGYDAARTDDHAMIDKRPAVIARCRDAADVIGVLAFARAHRVAIAVREPGSGALLVDLSRMRDITVDPVGRTVHVDAGCTWGEVERATEAAGVVTRPSADDLLGADIALLDGRFVVATGSRHTELFRSVRDGRAVGGVVTALTFRCQDAGGAS